MLQRSRVSKGAVGLTLMAALALTLSACGSSSSSSSTTSANTKPKITHVVSIYLENESFQSAFGSSSPAVYLNTTLRKQGVLITNFYGTSHVSLGNYIASLSGQTPTPTTQADCLASFDPVTPGTPTGTMGQVNGSSGCVYPSSVETLTNQLDKIHPPNPTTHVASWRGYEQDMGIDAARDGGTTCAHPATGGKPAIVASADDGYVTRHDPFVWFDSIISNTAECAANVVPLGTTTNNKPSASSPLVQDFSSLSTTPDFAFITPSVCNDGHDDVCTSPSAAGGTTGGLAAADAFLQQWMPTLLSSPAYKDGSMMILITFDEAEIGPPSTATACCSEVQGPNVTQNGINGPGGGRTGALVLASPKLIKPGSTDTKGEYNHFSELRTYEDLLGITTGGSDGKGHLGFAGQKGLRPFGSDVFNG